MKVYKRIRKKLPKFKRLEEVYIFEKEKTGVIVKGDGEEYLLESESRAEAQEIYDTIFEERE